MGPDNKCEVTAAKDKCGEMPLEVSDSLVNLSSSEFVSRRFSPRRASFAPDDPRHRMRNF